ncbi:hypothetical protein ABI59_22225 [Acidobacteria bacterium Mor1]|nr:hypothetical protein ABI59_22225 [Acidobacteria bacterium Mor1]
MNLRAKLLLYLIVIHALLGGIALVALRDSGPWLLAAEGVFLLSALAGYMLVRQFFVPLELIGTGADLIRERDFSSQFRHVGQPEMDALIDIYNEMIERLREERLKLQEQHVLMDKVLGASPSGFLNVDFEQRVRTPNRAAAEMLKNTPEDLDGLPLAELPGPLGRALARLETGDTTVVALQGGRRIRCRRVGLVDRGFERSFILLEELTRELRESEKAAYGKLIRMMSHEVNNSLGAVGSMLQSCRHYRDQLSDEDRGDFERALDVSLRRLQNLERFMNGFADVVRLPEPTPGSCRLDRLIVDLADLLRPDLAEREITLQTTLPDEEVQVHLDPHQFEQVLVNVVKNAAESIERKGTIRIDLGLREGLWELAVIDTGGGLDEDTRDKLFSPFFSTKRDGRGLGLTLVREILDRHGLEFSLDNVPGGAEFRVAIPPRR